MVDLSQLKKGKKIKMSNGEYHKVYDVKNYDNIYFVTTDDNFKTGFYNKDGTVWNEDNNPNVIVKIL